MKSDALKRADKAKLQDAKFLASPDIVVKVVCRYRAELFFKISRKTKLSRLFNAWTDRMETTDGRKPEVKGRLVNGSAKSDAASTHGAGSSAAAVELSLDFLFTHNGRGIDAEQTPEEAGIEDGDEILAVELMDLTDDAGAEEWVSKLLSCEFIGLIFCAGRFDETTATASQEELDR